MRGQDSDRIRVVIVPLHNEPASGTLASILRQAGLTMADFGALK